MTYDPARHHRRSIRLREYDYAQAGAYFVTLVCKDREPLFEDDRLRDIVEEAWLWLRDRHQHVDLDEYVVMPNHLHGVIVIRDVRRGGSRTAPTRRPQAIKPLGRLVGAFKTVSTRRINAIRGMLGIPAWQRNYYEHIIRDEEELNRIRQYVIENPLHWEQDPENPMVVRAGPRARPNAGAPLGDHRGPPLPGAP